MLNPAVFFPMIWIGVMLLTPFSELEFYPYSEDFYFFMFFYLIVFSLSSAIGGVVARLFPFNNYLRMRRFVIIRANINMYIFFMALSIILQVYNHASLLGYNWWTPENIVLYRYKIFEENEPVEFAWFSIFNFFFFTALIIIRIVKTDKYQKLLIYILISLFVYISAARASIFVIILLLYFYDWSVNGFRKIFTLVLLGILITIYYIIAEMTEKIGAQFGVLAYALAPSHAFDQILNGIRDGKDIELYSFQILHEVLYWTGIISEIPSKNLGFYLTPIPTNVYTIFGPYVLDYGIATSFIPIFFIGMMCGFIYKMASRKDNYFVFLNAMFTSLLLLSVFHDYFTSAGFVWLSVILAFLIIPLNETRNLKTSVRNLNNVYQ